MREPTLLMNHSNQHGFYQLAAEPIFVNALDVHNTKVYCASGWDGLRIYEFDQSRGLKEIAGFKREGYVGFVWVSEDLVCISRSYEDVSQTAQIELLELSDTDTIREIAIMETQYDFIDGMIHVENRVYVLGSYGDEPFQSTLDMVEISSDGQLESKGALSLDTRARALIVEGTLGYVVGNHGLYIIDLNDLSRVNIIEEYRLTGQLPIGIAKANSQIYLACQFDGIRRLVTDDASGHMAEVGLLSTAGPVNSVLIDDNLLYFCDSWHGIWLLDMENAMSPTELGFHAVRETRRLLLAENKLYVASWDGLYVLQPSVINT